MTQLHGRYGHQNDLLMALAFDGVAAFKPGGKRCGLANCIAMEFSVVESLYQSQNEDILKNKDAYSAKLQFPNSAANMSQVQMT